jgi:CcmD family protein
MARRVIVSVASMLALGVRALALQPPPQTEFVPMNSLPPADQLPAAPLLIAAYAFVWVALAAYLWSIWSRLGKIERDMRALQQRTGRSPVP